MPLQIRSLYALGLATLIAACAMDTAPSGAFATPEGNGPVVVFDLQHRPLPEIPIPNDVATFADPTSRTGLRVNVSTIADTRLEITARKGFADLEGWGTMQPITVSFENADATRSAPALDLDVIKGRMQDPTYDFKDDPVYVINLRTGVPAILDMGQGNFPSTIVDDTSYWPNDPHRSGQNLLFETNDEGAAGLPYSPRLDRDFDGFLKHRPRPDPPTPVAIVAPIHDQLFLGLAVAGESQHQVLVPFVVPVATGTDFRQSRHQTVSWTQFGEQAGPLFPMTPAAQRIISRAGCAQAGVVRETTASAAD